MGFRDIFRRVPTISVEAVKERTAASKGVPVILDVRETAEYKAGHIPGALHIPLSSLADRMGEIDAARPVITYCKAGVRSRSAAALLLGAGFADVRSMEGGMDAWRGLRATGAYDHGLAIITEGLSPGEVLGLALAFERGSGEFYRGLAELFSGEDAAATFAALVRAEEAHMKTITAAAADLGLPPLAPGAGDGLMEGAVGIDEALAWCREPGRTPFETLELAMQAEANSLDLYLKMLRRQDIAAVHAAIGVLAEEEKAHLQKLAALLQERA